MVCDNGLSKTALKNGIDFDTLEVQYSSFFSKESIILEMKNNIFLHK